MHSLKQEDELLPSQSYTAFATWSLLSLPMCPQNAPGDSLQYKENI